jgi:hypothetical protein
MGKRANQTIEIKLTPQKSPQNLVLLSRWNLDELVSQSGGFPLEVLDL